jgi:hypothetical protein
MVGTLVYGLFIMGNYSLERKSVINAIILLVLNIDHLELGTHKQNMDDKKNNPRRPKVAVRLTLKQKKEIA